MTPKAPSRQVSASRRLPTVIAYTAPSRNRSAGPTSTHSSLMGNPSSVAGAAELGVGGDGVAVGGVQGQGAVGVGAGGGEVAGAGVEDGGERPGGGAAGGQGAGAVDVVAGAGVVAQLD